MDEDEQWVWHDASEGVVVDGDGLWEHVPCHGFYVDRDDHTVCPAEEYLSA